MKQVITIIYFTDNAGKAHTIEFSLKNLILLAGGFFILMVVLMISAAFSLKLYIEKNRLVNELASVAAEKNSAEERIKEMGAKANKHEDIAEPASDLATNQTNEKNADREIGGKIEQVSLHGFQIKKAEEGDGFIIAFDLVKTNSIGEISQGYVFIVVDYGGAYFCFPEGIEIKNGSPVDFKKGDRFSIKWQKHMEQIFPLSMDNVIKAVNVFVFSADGNLIIKKEAAL